MRYENSYKISVNLTPWFDKGFRFTKLHMIEEIGGNLASGTIDLECNGSDEALELITKEFTGTLTVEKDGGNTYEIDIFIINRKFYKNFLTLNFYCISDSKFITEQVSLEHSNIDSAISVLYPGKQDIRCESDIDSSLIIYQNCETNYSLCSKLARSYKQKSIFGFGFDGLMIKELIGIDSGGNKEPFWNLYGNVQVHQLDEYSLNYNKNLYQFPKNPWEENEYEKNYLEFSSKNLSSIKLYNDYKLVGKDYYPLMNNYLYNFKYSSYDMFTSFRVVNLDMPVYKLGDVINYSRKEQDNNLPFRTYLIRSNELFLAIDGSNQVDSNGLNFSWTSKLVGLEEDGSLLPETDPTII